MSDLISREDAVKHIKAYRDEFKEDFGIDSEDGDDASHHFGYIAGLNRATRIIECLPSAEPDNDMIHLQKEQAYLQGWEEGREALKQETEIWAESIMGIIKQGGL